MSYREAERAIPGLAMGSSEWIDAVVELSHKNPTKAKALFNAAMNSDSLTGLLNKQGIDHVLTKLEEDKRPSGIFYFDLMGFKEVNDTEGHAAGDEQLKRFAERLDFLGEVLSRTFRTNVYDRREKQREGTDRRTDVETRDLVQRIGHCELSRIGGDEFVAVLPNVSDYQTLSNIGFRAARNIIHTSGCPQTAIGAALYTPGEGTIIQTLDEADAAMFVIKRALKESYKEGEPFRAETGLAVDTRKNGFQIYKPENLRRIVN